MDRRSAIRNSALVAGSAIMAPALLSLLQSCKEQPRLTWKPSFLSNDHAALISTLVDTVLPKTATPGGLELKVDMFIDMVFAQIFDKAGQDQVVAEMTAFNQKCKDQYGKFFNELSTDERNTFLKAEEANSPKYNGSVWGTRVGDQKPVGFYRSMKSMMLWGYCSSEEIGKNVLKYDPIPGEYLGCIPLAEVGATYSL